MCREVAWSWESGAVCAQYDKARLSHGLPLLTPQDWVAPLDTDEPVLAQIA